jgi:MFS family permease
MCLNGSPAADLNSKLFGTHSLGAALLIGTPTLIFYGWLSDKFGRNPVILGGFLLAALTYYPLYSWLGAVTQLGNINNPVAILIIAILVSYVGMVYKPIGAYRPGCRAPADHRLLS